MAKGIQGQEVFLREDIRRALQAILQTTVMAQAAGAGNQMYHAGFVAALTAVATAVEVDLELPYTEWNTAGRLPSIIEHMAQAFDYSGMFPESRGPRGNNANR